MNQLDQLLANLAILPGHYSRTGTKASVVLSLSGSASATFPINNYWSVTSGHILVPPSSLAVNINGVGYAVTNAASMDLTAAASWDNTATTLNGLTCNGTIASHRAAQTVYVYACAPLTGPNPFLILSFNATVPSGTPPSGCSAYSASTTRKIAGFQCLCDGGPYMSIYHGLYGLVTGDILPCSLWDLVFMDREGHRPYMVYDPRSDTWYGLHMASQTGANTNHGYGGTVSISRNWMDSVDDGHLASIGPMRLLRDSEFQSAAFGGNEQTTVFNSILGATGSLTAGRVINWKQTTGSGLSDLSAARIAQTSTPSDTDTSVISMIFEATIDATGTPDTFKWRTRLFGGNFGSYQATGVAITGAAQTLQDASTGNAITITFAATTGHTLNNVWTVACMNGMYDTNEKRMVSDIGCESMAGAYYQWLDEQSWRYDPDTNYADGGSTTQIPVTYEAAPGGEPIYLKEMHGVWYLCAALTGAVDLFVGTAPNKIPIAYDALASTGGYPVYFDNAQDQPGKLRCNISAVAGNVVVQSPSLGIMELIITHAATPSGSPLYYNDAQSRLECNNGTGTMYVDLAIPGFSYYGLPGSKGQLYKEGVNGDVKLTAGATWGDTSDCGSRSRHTNYYRWSTNSDVGGRFAAEPQ